MIRGAQGHPKCELQFASGDFAQQWDEISRTEQLDINTPCPCSPLTVFHCTYHLLCIIYNICIYLYLPSIIHKLFRPSFKIPVFTLVKCRVGEIISSSHFLSCQQTLSNILKVISNKFNFCCFVDRKQQNSVKHVSFN